MASLLPLPRQLSPRETVDQRDVQAYADLIGALCDNLLRSNTDAFQLVEAVADNATRDKALAAMVDSDECLTLARERLREGFILLQQSVLRRPEGYL